MEKPEQKLLFDGEPAEEQRDKQQADIEEILLNTQEQGQMMEQLIKSQIQVKDEMINKLHKELDYYKQEAAEKYVDQVMKAVIKVRRDMKKLISSENWNTMTVEDLKREYSYVLDDITDLLAQQNIDPFSSQPGCAFDPSIHSAKLEPTNDPELDKRIKASLTEGYKKGDKVIQAERVIAYQYK